MISRDARFWRNVTIIALLHVAVLVAFIRWSKMPRRTPTKDVVWINGGAGEAGERAIAGNTARAPEKSSIVTPAPELKGETPTPEEEKEEPMLTSAKSEIQLPTPTPRETSTPAPLPTATPKPKPTLAPTPRPTPKHIPKKKVIAKATPKPTAKPKKKEKEEEEKEETAETKKKKEIAKTALAKNEKESDESGSSDKPVKKATAAHGSKKGSSGESSGNGSGAGGAAEFGWYGNMLHDRFYSEWVQPITSVPSGAKLSALVKIRIEKDGTVSNFKVVRPSGNVVVDESVEAIAKHVTQVDPLPAGLGDGDHYDVNINFELNPEE